jgi:hypothetical protein
VAAVAVNVVPEMLTFACTCPDADESGSTNQARAPLRALLGRSTPVTVAV